jgi:hypothetical protein
MSPSLEPSDTHNSLITTLRSIARLPARVFNGFLLPVFKDLWHVGCAICHPLVRGSTQAMSTTVRNLHNKKHWMSRLGATFWGNAIGLAIAMISAQLLSNFVEVPGAKNLWGLFSQRTLLSENSYRVVSFLAEFIVTLIVFSAVEYVIDLRNRKKLDEATHDDEA